MASHRRDVAPQTGTVDTSGTGGHQDVREVVPESDGGVRLANDPATTPNVDEGTLTAFEETTKANPEAAASVANPPQPRLGPVTTGGEGFVAEGTGPSRDPEAEPRFAEAEQPEAEQPEDGEPETERLEGEEPEDQQRYGKVEDEEEQQRQQQEEERARGRTEFRVPDARSVVSAGRLQPDEDFTEPGEGEAFEPDQPQQEEDEGDGGDEERGDQGPPLTTDEAEPRVDQTGQPGEQAQPSDADQQQADGDGDDGDQEQQTTEADSDTTEAQDYDIPQDSVPDLEEWVEEPDDLDQQKARAQAALDLENSEEGKGRKTARSFLESKLAEEPEGSDDENDGSDTSEGGS